MNTFRSTPVAFSLLIAASLALTLGFACALPLAAFAAIAALSFGPLAGALALVAVWAANQACGFAVLHYPLDATTLAWGGALGLLGLAAYAAARATLARVGGLLGAGVAFLAAFAVFQGMLFALDVGAGLDPSVFVTPILVRLFVINLAAFGALLAARALLTRGHAVDPAPALRGA
jgi:hypothetical protein